MPGRNKHPFAALGLAGLAWFAAISASASDPATAPNCPGSYELVVSDPGETIEVAGVEITRAQDQEARENAQKMVDQLFAAVRGRSDQTMEIESRIVESDSSLDDRISRYITDNPILNRGIAEQLPGVGVSSADPGDMMGADLLDLRIRRLLELFEGIHRASKKPNVVSQGLSRMLALVGNAPKDTSTDKIADYAQQVKVEGDALKKDIEVSRQHIEFMARMVEDARADRSLLNRRIAATQYMMEGIARRVHELDESDPGRAFLQGRVLDLLERKKNNQVGLSRKFKLFVQGLENVLLYREQLIKDAREIYGIVIPKQITLASLKITQNVSIAMKEKERQLDQLLRAMSRDSQPSEKRPADDVGVEQEINRLKAFKERAASFVQSGKEKLSELSGLAREAKDYLDREKPHSRQ